MLLFGAQRNVIPTYKIRYISRYKEHHISLVDNKASSVLKLLLQVAHELVDADQPPLEVEGAGVVNATGDQPLVQGNSVTPCKVPGPAQAGRLCCRPGPAGRRPWGGGSLGVMVKIGDKDCSPCCCL